MPDQHEKDSEVVAKQIRIKALGLAHSAKASHLGGAFSVADVLAVLYTDIIRFRAEEPKWPDRDRLLYSKGHSCTALYAILEHFGYFDHLSEQFGRDGSYFTTHVSHHVPGVELSTGSLGHALPYACGIAYAGLKKRAQWKVYCIVSDGELDEGSNWEAILFAGHHKLSNLCLIIDANKIQSLGRTEEVLDLEPLEQKFQSFKWEATRLDGHNHSMLRKSASRFAAGGIDRPSVLILDTVKGKGVSFMENQLLWHYRSPDDVEYDRALEELRKQREGQ